MSNFFFVLVVLGWACILSWGNGHKPGMKGASMELAIEERHTLWLVREKGIFRRDRKTDGGQ